LKVNDQFQIQGALNPKKDPRVRGWGGGGEDGRRGRRERNGKEGEEGREMEG
jgi:hypothetical protein